MWFLAYIFDSLNVFFNVQMVKVFNAAFMLTFEKKITNDMIFFDKNQGRYKGTNKEVKNIYKKQCEIVCCDSDLRCYFYNSLRRYRQHLYLYVSHLFTVIGDVVSCFLYFGDTKNNKKSVLEISTANIVLQISPLQYFRYLVRKTYNSKIQQMS